MEQNFFETLHSTTNINWSRFACFMPPCLAFLFIGLNLSSLPCSGCVCFRWPIWKKWRICPSLLTPAILHGIICFMYLASYKQYSSSDLHVWDSCMWTNAEGKQIKIRNAKQHINQHYNLIWGFLSIGKDKIIKEKIMEGVMESLWV